MVAPFVSICCWLCLLSVLCIFCVVRVPSESVVWLIFDSMVSLASRAVVLSLMECMIYKLIDMLVMVAAEMEVKFLRTIGSLRNELRMEKAGGEYQAKEWKRRTEALRDEIRLAQLKSKQ